MITKYATFENAQVLGIKGSTEHRTASFDRFSDFEDFRTEDGFLYARIRAISSRVNKNHDGWPSVELAGTQDIFDQHRAAEGGFVIEASRDATYGFSTFLGKPVFVDHHNSDPQRARGVIADAKLHVEDYKTASKHDPYYASATVDPRHLPPTWVELLLEVDARSFPKLAKAIIEGAKNPKKGIDGFSMGANVERSVCSICKNSATAPDEYCNHVRMKGAYFDYIDPKTKHKTSRRSYENCEGIQFFEISAVFDPADETALLREVRASTHEGGIFDRFHRDPVRQLNKAIKGFDWGTWNPDTCDGYVGGPQPLCGQPTKYHLRALPKEGMFGLGDDDRYLCPEHYAELMNNPRYNRDYTTSEYVSDGQGERPNTFQSKVLDEEEREDSATVGKDRYPMPDKEHAELALDFIDKGGLSESEKAKVRERAHKLIKSNLRTADNPPPQSDLVHAPQQIDTLRQQKVCEVCGSDMDEETCQVCGWTEPPEHFNNPDLEKAKHTDLQNPNQGGNDTMPPDQGGAPPPVHQQPNNQQMFAHVTNDMRWDISHPRTAGLVHPTEQPLTTKGSVGNGPKTETIVKDQSAPVTSSVHADFLQAAGHELRTTTMDHTAEAASGAPSVAKPDANVDVLGVGGVMDASNEAASKADAQVDVNAIGGTGVEGVEAESTANVDQGDEHSKNVEAIPTKTFGDGSSGVERQEDPVTSEPFPASEDGVKASHWVVESYNDAPFPEDDGGLAGGTAVKGVKPVSEQFGDRVDLFEHPTSPANNSGPTKTWSGTDGNGVLRQQDPVTPESIALGDFDGIYQREPATSSHIFAAFRLADLEVDMGIIDSDQKYARVAQLEEQSPSLVEAALRYAQRVRTAGLAKTPKTASRLPIMGQSSHTKEASVDQTEELSGDDNFLWA